MKRPIQRLALVLTVSFFSIASSCDETTPTDTSISAERVIDSSNDGEQISLLDGQVLIVRLDSSPSTGFVWEVSEVDGAVLQLIGIPRFEAGSSLLGAEGVQIFEFRTINPGQTELKMVYVRAFEEGAEPADTFSVSVTVR